MKRYRLLRPALLLIVLVGALANRAAAQTNKPARAYAPNGSYAVVVSRETLSQESWAEVVDVMRTKYDAALITYQRGHVASVAESLGKCFPRYACFITTPSEADREFVVNVHRLTRRLDEDPYTDMIWGILTGYDAGDALRIARRDEPLEVRRAASSMGPGVFENLEGGFASNERKKRDFWRKDNGGRTKHEAVEPDAVKKLVESFNNRPPDVFITSGHATQRDWQVYYNIRGGEFRCRKGQLYGRDSNGKIYEINSPHPKIYMPVGNCLIGNIDRRDCMATAWMHTGGVHQMFGYTAVTFYGYMGWGVQKYFRKPWTFSEAFYFINQSLVHKLHAEYPEKADIEFDGYDRRRDLRRIRMKYGFGGKDKDLFGLLWDRDTVAFYGDPAWVVRWPGQRDWSYDVEHNAESVVVTVEALAGGRWPKHPVFVPLQPRLKDIRGLKCSGAEIEAVIADNFILLPLEGKSREKGDRIVVRFGARPVEAEATSAQAEAIRAVPAEREKPDKTGAGAKIPPRMVRPVSAAIHAAGPNRSNIVSCLRKTSGRQYEDMLFLVANMPLRDLRSLSSDYLLENVKYARKAKEQTPWGKHYTEGIFRNYVLPYASLSESRDEWRKLFYEKLMPVVEDCDTAGQAAVKMNTTIFDKFGVEYHATKRPRPDQGPLESIEAGFASCTGLSVMLVDACRAVGVPARIAGVAKWKPEPKSGNHTWVEIRDDDGRWRVLGAAESSALDKVWFAEAASQVNPDHPMCRIYAVVYERRPLRFPMAWNPYANYVSATDRTDFYKSFKGKK